MRTIAIREPKSNGRLHAPPSFLGPDRLAPVSQDKILFHLASFSLWPWDFPADEGEYWLANLAAIYPGASPWLPLFPQTCTDRLAKAAVPPWPPSAAPCQDADWYPCVRVCHPLVRRDDTEAAEHIGRPVAPPLGAK